MPHVATYHLTIRDRGGNSGRSGAAPIPGGGLDGHDETSELHEGTARGGAGDGAEEGRMRGGLGAWRAGELCEPVGEGGGRSAREGSAGGGATGSTRPGARSR